MSHQVNFDNTQTMKSNVGNANCEVQTEQRKHGTQFLFMTVDRQKSSGLFESSFHLADDFRQLESNLLEHLDVLLQNLCQLA